MRKLLSLVFLAIISIAGLTNNIYASCSVRGTILDSSSNPVSGVTVFGCVSYGGFCYSPTLIETTTSATGKYTFASTKFYGPYTNPLICDNEYIIQPTLPSHSFSPSYQYVTIADGANVTDIDFTMF